MNQIISRRNFVASAAGATAAAVVASRGIVAKADEAVWDEQADFVILGWGMAGMGAAKKACLENGLTAIVIEKQTKELSGGAGSAFLGLFGHSRDHIVNGTTSGGYIDEAMDDRINAAQDANGLWAIDNGVQLFASEHDNGGYTFMSTYNAGKGIYDSLRGILEPNEGLTIHYSSIATRLVMDEDGAVLGVEASIDGTPTRIGANKGVIIATGNYAGNKELVSGTLQYRMPYAPACDSKQVGEGVFLAVQAGAMPFTNTSLAYELFAWAMAKPSAELGEGMILNDTTSGGSDEFNQRVFVNGTGERFMNEAQTFLHDHTRLPFFDWTQVNPSKAIHYTHLPMWTIYDSKIMDTHKMFIQEEGNINWTFAKAHDIYQWSDDNQAEVERGWIYKADTLEDLAAQMVAVHECDGEEFHVDVEKFVETIRNYNDEICASGVDPFGKDPAYLVPLDTPPFYAIETVPMIGYTISGLDCDCDMRVLDYKAEPIANLYAAGDIAGLRAQCYPFGTGPSFAMGGFAVETALR